MAGNETKLKIVGMGGSLRPASRSLSVLKIALAAATEAGAVTELLDINKLELPFFRPGVPAESFPDSAYVEAYLAKFVEADGFIWCPPTYHAAPSAAFKNALDFLELLPRRPALYLTGKAAGLITVAGGVNYGQVSLASLLHNARALRLLIAPGSLQISPGKRLFDAEGRLLDDKMRLQIEELGAEVVRLARMLKYPAENKEG